MLIIFINFIISLLLGLLIGIERERSQVKGTQAFGVRTFILFSLMGTLAATLNQIYITFAICLFIFGIILLGYYRSTDQRQQKIDIGVTTEISGGIVFCLGYMIPSANLLAITIGSIVLLVLFERKRLHTLARKKFKPHEIEATIILIIFSLGILPLLPDKTIDAWNLFNPRNFGILMATIAGIQFAGYVAIRLFGERFGMAITAFLGGLVSSTAVFATLNSTLRTHPNFTLSVMASAIFAVLAMLVEIIAIIWVASSSLFYFIAPPILVMIVCSILIGLTLLHFEKNTIHNTSAMVNPLNLLSIFYTSLFIAITIVIIAVAKRFISNKMVMLISFLGGLFEIHGISLATALLYLNQNLSISSTQQILYTAVAASFVSKFFLLFSLTPIRFALKTAALLIFILSSGALTFFLTQ